MTKREKRTETMEEAMRREGWRLGGYKGQACWMAYSARADGGFNWTPVWTPDSNGNTTLWYLPKTSDTPPPKPVPQEYEIETLEEAMRRKGYIKGNEVIATGYYIIATESGCFSNLDVVTSPSAVPWRWYKPTNPFEMPKRKRIQGPKFDIEKQYLTRADGYLFTHWGTYMIAFHDSFDAIWEIENGEPGRRIK